MFFACITLKIQGFGCHEWPLSQGSENVTYVALSPVTVPLLRNNFTLNFSTERQWYVFECLQIGNRVVVAFSYLFKRVPILTLYRLTPFPRVARDCGFLYSLLDSILIHMLTRLQPTYSMIN
jgi:hypothetical protein